jgi:hypothetical protein
MGSLLRHKTEGLTRYYTFYMNITDEDEMVWTTSSKRKYKEPCNSGVQYTKLN